METNKNRPKCNRCQTYLYSDGEGGFGCNTCEAKEWDSIANGIIKDFKCPVCGDPTELIERDYNYVEFGCKAIFDKKGNYARPPCPSFRIMVCEECFGYPCQCQEYPEHPGREY